MVLALTIKHSEVIVVHQDGRILLVLGRKRNSYNKFPDQWRFSAPRSFQIDRITNYIKKFGETEELTRRLKDVHEL